MSRKTKEKKKIATYRKKLRLLQQITRANNQIQDTQTQIKKNKELEINNKKPTEASIENGKKTMETQAGQTYFIKDLKKSLFIIFLIITLEIIIYFARINR